MSDQLIVDDEEVVVTPTEETTPTLDSVIPAEPEDIQATPAEPVEDDLPEKYRGKTAKQIAEMHMNAEKQMGKQSSEVGQLRGIVDDFIKAQSQPTPEQKPEVEKIDILDDPEGAVNQLVENHPDIKAARESLQTVEQKQRSDELRSLHPDVEEVFNDPAFAEWIQKSGIRSNALVNAHQSNDIAAADELLSEWKATKPAETVTPAQTDPVLAAAAEQNKQAAATGAIAGGSMTSKKIYRKADIRNLIRTDRARYDALQPEIMAAYAEGRVR